MAFACAHGVHSVAAAACRFRLMHPLFPFMPMQRAGTLPRGDFRRRRNGPAQDPAMRATILSIIVAVLLGTSCTNPESPRAERREPTHPELVARGKYLVDMMACHDCHSPKIMTPDGPVPDPERLLSGHPADEPGAPVDGNAGMDRVVFNMGFTSATGPWGTSFSGNLTSDATGIGNWTEEQFRRAITKGLYKGIEGARPLLPPMPWQTFKGINDEDLHAIFTFLQSTKPVVNVVPAPLPPAAPSTMAIQ